MRISPLQIGDQPFVSWHSILKVLPSISYEHTSWPRRRWADFRKSSFTPCSGRR